MMHNVLVRNVGTKIYFNYTVCRFMSRICLKILSTENIIKFRKVEKELKKALKLEADILHQKNSEINEKLKKKSWLDMHIKMTVIRGEMVGKRFTPLPKNIENKRWVRINQRNDKWCQKNEDMGHGKQYKSCGLNFIK